MRRLTFLAAACVLAVAAGPHAQQPQPQPAADPIKATAENIGATTLKTLQFTAFGANFSVGQSPNPTEAWPRVTVKSYDAQIDYDKAAMRLDLVREQGAIPPRGGGVPFTGEQRQSQVVLGAAAWDVAPAPAAPAGGRRGGGPPPAAEPGRITTADALALAGIRPPGPPPPTPQLAAAVDRMLQIWLTPHGFIRGAMANNATSRKVGTSTEVTFTLPSKHKFVGILNSRNEVEKVTTWVDNPVLGDMPIEAIYSNYQRMDAGVLFPLRIIQNQGGYPALELWVSAMKPNPTVDITLPDNVKAATLPPVTVTVQKVAEGIFYLTGGTHHSVAIEMRDHVVLVEAPLNEARSLAVVAKVKETIPNKPIKFVVNTHQHFDHSGGLRTLVDEGATVVTHQMNRAFYEKAWASPHTLGPDKLAQSKKPATFMTFTERHVLTDGARTIELHRIANSPHNDGFVMVYVPSAKLLIEADAYTPAPVPPPPGANAPAGGAARAGGAPAGPAAPGAAPAAPGAAPAAGRAGGAPAAPAAPPPVSPTTLNLYQNIQRLKLDVTQIAALHGPRLATLEDLRNAVTPATPPAGTAQ